MSNWLFLQKLLNRERESVKKNIFRTWFDFNLSIMSRWKENLTNLWRKINIWLTMPWVLSHYLILVEWFIGNVLHAEISGLIRISNCGWSSKGERTAFSKTKNFDRWSQILTAAIVTGGRSFLALIFKM